jgi:hypothetical protein
MRIINGVEIDDVATIREAHEARETGNFWFAPGAMRGFQTRIEDAVYGERYFVTSEQHEDEPRRWTVRQISDDGDITSASTFQEFDTSDDAHTAAQDYAGKL